MNQSQPILYLPQPCELAVPVVLTRMQQSGLQVIRTFDLHQTRVTETGCSCPHHGSEPCDCQMVVLLVYGEESQPVSLIAHGHNGQTWFLLGSFLGAPNGSLEHQIRRSLNPAEVIQILAGRLEPGRG